VDENTNTILINDPATPLTLVTLTVPSLTYTGASFATWLTATLNSGSVLGTATWAVAFEEASGKLTVSNTAGQAFEFPAHLPDFTAEDILGIVRGIRPDASVDVAGTAVWESPHLIRVTHAPFVYVVIEWEGIRSLVTARYEDTAGNRLPQTGYKAVVGLAQAPSQWLQACIVKFASVPRWWVASFPNVVKMELYSHDWQVVKTNMVDWAVHFRLFDLPGERTSDNHVFIADSSLPYMSQAPADFNQRSLDSVKHPLTAWSGAQRRTTYPGSNREDASARGANKRARLEHIN
jgi:hypothetical protein